MSRTVSLLKHVLLAGPDCHTHLPLKTGTRVIIMMSILSHTNVEVENQKDSLLTKGVTAISVFCHQLGLSLEFPLVGGARS